MQYFKLNKNKRLHVIGLSCAFSLGALFLSTAASASLVVIGSKDIQVNKLNTTQLSSIFLGKSVSLPTGETLNPIDQGANSKIYSQFYEQIAGMDASSVNSYWSNLTFSGTGTQPPEVAGDRSAIASVENSRKAIAYVDSSSLGAQIANVKVLYGTVSSNNNQSSASAQNSAAQNNPYYTKHRATDDQLRQKLSQEIAALRIQQQHYQQLNDERQRQLLEILKAEQSVQKKHPEATAAISTAPKQTVEVTAPHDLWSAMRSHFTLNSDSHQQEVNKQLAWYLSHKWVVQMIIKNAEPYIGYVYQQTQQRDMPAEFALLPMVESGYVPFATSSAGASGLWQIMPNTASSNGVKINWWYDGRLDIVNSTNAALDYLVRLKSGLHSWALAAAAYNAGEGEVLSAVDHNKRKDLSTNYWSLPLPEETKNYFPKLLALAKIIKNPAKYGIKLPPLTTQPNFAVITLHSQIDRAQIADLADTSEEVVRELNPGMLRWATGPHGSYTLAIPTDKLATFKINLARLANQKRLLWVYHGIKDHESLSDVARAYHTTVAELEKVNQLKSANVKQGQGLVVPVFSNSTYAGFSAAVQGATAQMQVAKKLSQAKVTALPQQKQTAPAKAQSVDSVTAHGLLDDSYANVRLASRTNPKQPTAATSQQPTAATSQQPASGPDDLKTLMNKLYE